MGIKRKKQMLLWILVVVLSCIAGILALKLIFPFDKKGKAESVEEESITDIEEGSYTYATETIYVGKPQLNSVLFETPFQKSDSYKTNIDYIKSYGTEEAQKLVDATKLFVEDLFSVAHNDPKLKEQSIIEESLDNGLFLVFEDGTQISGKQEFLEKYLAWIKENKITMETECITDPCLVYSDLGKEIVRCQVLLTVYESIDTSVLEQEFKLPEGSITLGEEISMIMEVYHGTKNIAGDRNNFYIDSLHILE